MKKLLLIFVLLASVCDASTLAKVLEIKADVDAIKQVLAEKNIPFTNLADIANSLDSKLPLYSGGDGTASDPFLVFTTSHFLAIGSGDAVDYASGSWDMDKHYKQIADIDFDGVDFTPIGYGSGSGYTSFTGSYDGNGYKISNVAYNAGAHEYIGLFAVGDGATFKNIGIESAEFSSTHRRIAVLVGALFGSKSFISNCYVANASISTTTSEGQTFIGPLVGQAGGDAEIRDSYADGVLIHAPNANHTVGGLLGSAYSSGSSIFEMHNCWANTTITANTSGSAFSALHDASAFTGRSLDYSTINCKFNNTTHTVGIRNAYTQGTVTSDTTGTEGLSTADMYKQASYSGWDFTDTWQINEDESYPFFQAPYPVQSPAPAE